MPSGENVRARTLPVWPTSVQRSRPVVGSHSLMVLSCAAGGDRLPVGRVGHRMDHPGVPFQRVTKRRPGRVGDVPDLHRAVPAPRDQGPTVGRERDGFDDPRVSPEPVVEIGELSAGGHVPESDGPIDAPRGQDPAVGREGQGVDSESRGRERPTQFPGGHVPQQDRPGRGGRQDCPVGREGHGPRGGPVGGEALEEPTGLQVPQVPAVIGQGPAVDGEAEDRARGARTPGTGCSSSGSSSGGRSRPDCHVPQLDRAVGTPRRQGLAVGCEGQRIDDALVPREDVSLRPGAGDVPELDRSVLTPRRQRPPAVQERDGPHEVRVALQRRPCLAGLDDPQPDRVRVRRREIAAIRREGHAEGHGVRLTSELDLPRVPRVVSRPTAGPPARSSPRRGTGRRRRRRRLSRATRRTWGM